MKTIPKAEVTGLTKAQNPIQIVVLIAVSIITVCGRSTWFRHGRRMEIRFSLPLSSGRLLSLAFG